MKYFGGEWDSPQTYQETYNLLHSLKRSSRVEIAIGLLKQRFRSLAFGLCGNPLILQKSTLACAHLHNFIQRREGNQDVITSQGFKSANSGIYYDSRNN